MNAASPRPVIAVIVPWGGSDLDLLIRQLARLRDQVFDGDFEIRVAVNHVAGSVHAARLEACSTDRRRVRVIDASAQRGPAFARNHAVAVGPADVLLFCDADDEVQEGWVGAMTAALSDDRTVVGGALVYGRLNATPFALSRATGLPVALGHLPFTPSAALGMRSDLFIALGGFDERFISGEDIDICWRAQYLGARMRFAPEARVDYRLRQTPRALFAQGYRYSRADLQLLMVHEHAGVRRRLRDTAAEAARVGVLLALSPFGRARLFKFSARAGTVAGHLRWSAGYRRFFV